MSTQKFILLIGTVLFLLIFFGRSPMDEVRKKRAERASKKLIEKIEESNKKNDKYGQRPLYNTQNGTHNNGTLRGVNPRNNNGGNNNAGDGGEQTPSVPINNGPNPFVDPYQQQQQTGVTPPPPGRM